MGKGHHHHMVAARGRRSIISLVKNRSSARFFTLKFMGSFFHKMMIENVGVWFQAAHYKQMTTQITV